MVIFAIIFFVTKEAAMAAAFGGLISAVNTLLVGYHTNNQANKNLKPGQSVGVMVLSVIQRMLILVMMVYRNWRLQKMQDYKPYNCSVKRQ